MGFACGGLWGMGYNGPMGYSMQIPAHQVGRQVALWDIRGYGLWPVWVKSLFGCCCFKKCNKYLAAARCLFSAWDGLAMRSLKLTWSLITSLIVNQYSLLYFNGTSGRWPTCYTLSASYPAHPYHSPSSQHYFNQLSCSPLATIPGPDSEETSCTLSYIYSLWCSLGGRTAHWASRTNSMWAGNALWGVRWACWHPSMDGTWKLQICLTRRATRYFSIHLCDGVDNKACWGALSEV